MFGTISQHGSPSALVPSVSLQVTFAYSSIGSFAQMSSLVPIFTEVYSTIIHPVPWVCIGSAAAHLSHNGSAPTVQTVLRCASVDFLIFIYILSFHGWP